MQLRTLLLPATLLLGCARATPPAPPAPVLQLAAGPARLTLFVTADVRGQLVPCGCSAAMRGGLGRAAAQIAAARASGVPTLFLDAGDALFERTGLAEDEAVGEERKAQAVASAFKAMGLAVRAPGPLDNARGEPFRLALELPELLSGAATVLSARPGAAGTGYAAAPVQVGVAAGKTAAELEQAAAALRAGARPGGAARFVVGLLAGAPSAAADARAVDLVIAAQAPEVVGAEWDDGRLFPGTPPVAQLQTRGRSLLRVDVALAPDGGRPVLARGQGDIERELKAQSQRLELLKTELGQPRLSPERRALLEARVKELVASREQLAASAQSTALAPGTFTVRFIPLEAALPSDPAVDAIVADYDREVAQLNLAWAREHGQSCPPAAKGEAAYVGNEACRACHARAFTVYGQSGHSHAYATLEKVSKQYRLDCIACHVTGFQQPGGVCRVDQVEGRAQVGCENCHGPGSLHVVRPTRTNIPRPAPGQNVCLGCHTPENSLHFDFARYLPRILGPGHAARGK